jgi:hypothetical protein
MSNRTSFLSSTAPGSQNTPLEKTAFYVFHILPEYFLVCTLLAFNTKEIFNTGLKGDHQWRDETPEEREKREAKEAKKREEKNLDKV